MKNQAIETKIAWKFKGFRDGLDEYQGETLSEKAESYLLSIGVTQAEIANIKNIMVVHSEE